MDGRTKPLIESLDFFENSSRVMNKFLLLDTDESLAVLAIVLPYDYVAEPTWPTYLIALT